MVIKSAFGQLKDRWRFPCRKSEVNTFLENKCFSLSLHNICIEEGDNIPRKLDLAFKEGLSTNRNKKTVRNGLWSK